MNTEEQLAKIYGELEDMIDVQVYSHELRDDLIDAAKAVYKARETAYRVLTKGQKDKYGMTIGSSVISGSIKDELKKEIRKVLEKNGYSSIQDGVDAAADYILMEDEYYSPSLSELPSIAEKWFRETKESFPETLIKASKTIKSYIDNDVDEENNRYNDDELRELPPDADDNDYDYGDWESGRPMYSNCKSIKSSLEDRLLNLLEEFEEGYADTINRDAQEGTTGVYNDAFLEGFKNDYNLTNEDIEKLREAVHNIWNETANEIAKDEIRDMGEMYGVPRGATPEEALKHFE